MAWQNEIVRIVRHLISDIDTDDPTYDNSRLEETVLVAAQLVRNELEFATNYTIDVDAATFTPDPTDSPKDNDFITLISLKASLLILASEYKTYSVTSMRISDGPSSIDTTDMTRNAKFLYENALADYIRAKNQYRAGNSVAGQAILSPYTYAGIMGIFNPN